MYGMQVDGCAERKKNELEEQVEMLIRIREAEEFIDNQIREISVPQVLGTKELATNELERESKSERMPGSF